MILSVTKERLLSSIQYATGWLLIFFSGLDSDFLHPRYAGGALDGFAISHLAEMGGLGFLGRLANRLRRVCYNLAQWLRSLTY